MFMKILFKLFVLFFLFISFFNIWNSAFSIKDIFNDAWPEVRYCQDDNCWLKPWIEIVKENIDWIVTDQPASEYAQSVVKYILWFIYLVAVVLIIYAWFNLMIWLWNEEKAKQTKTMLIYVIIWLAIIFLANSIVSFVVKVLEAWNII